MVTLIVDLLVHELGNAEVPEKRPCLRVEKDIGRLDIAVEHSLTVDVVKRRGDGG